MLIREAEVRQSNQLDLDIDLSKKALSAEKSNVPMVKEQPDK